MKLNNFERYPLTFGETHIEHLPRLTKAVGADIQIYAKREDCNSGLAMGGNKLRKLEYIVPDILASGADTLVSVGGVQSNHTRMVAAVAAKLGLKCVVIQESWVPHSDAVYDRVGNILMTRLMGAQSKLSNEGFDIGIRKSWKDAMQSVIDAGGKPYPIPAGASVHKFGGLGYVGFAEEVKAQEASMGITFDYIIVCSVTGSTQAGMIVGFAAENRADRVIGIDASGTPEQLRGQMREIVDKTANLVELGRKIEDREIIINPDYAYPAYGVPSEETNDAIRLAARTEAMITDPVYEGKSMQAGAAMAVVGWWTGYKLGGVVALFTAEFFENQGLADYWQATFLILGVLVILMNIGLMFVHEPVENDRQKKQRANDQIIIDKLGSNNILTNFIAYITGTIGGPIISFFKKNGLTIALGILGFVFLFKIGEAFLGRMSIVFYKEIGFSKGQIAIYSKGLGWITTVVFTLLGGVMAMRAGTIKTMFFAGGLMALTNLIFALLAWVGKSELLFAIAVIADDITAAFATVAFVAFISLLVDRTYTATQYALLASIGTAGRTTLASSSGALVDWLNGDWGTFFVMTTIMVIPSLICLWFIRNKVKIGEK